MMAVEAGGGRRLQFEFRGSGLEFFRIWIINISLTLLTLGIYSAWARVRTKRYFHGNTFLDGHSFDYHASPWRILAGRAIALALFIVYNVSVSFRPYYAYAWFGLFLVALPWLIISSLRFNARNTSYRNVRFNFTGQYGIAFATHIAWPIAGTMTLGILIPMARRARDFFHINHHTYGGKPFLTGYKPWNIYAIYLMGLGIGIALVIGIWVGVAYLVYSAPYAMPPAASDDTSVWLFFGFMYGMFAVIGFVWFFVGTFIDTLVFNLGIGNTMIDGRHKLESKLSVFVVVWIRLSNMLLTLLTLGLLYPWAKVRLARYQAKRMALIATSDMSEYTSEFYGSQSAVGEQIGSLFDVDLGL